MAGLRISGLASGMDIDSIVSDMMKIKRMPLDKLKQDKQTKEWQRDDYRSMNTLLLDFRSELTQMKLTTRYRTRTTTTTDESKVSATASSAASLSSYTIKSVEQLATAATKVNAGAISKPNASKIDPNQGLHTIRGDFATTTFGWKTGSVESKTISVSNDTASFSLDLKDGVKVDMSKIQYMNVKVSGKAYKVVAGDPGENQVKIDENGNLNFKDNIAKNSTIKVDYIADKKIEEFTFSEDASGFSLTKGSLNSISKFTVGNSNYDIEYTSEKEWTIKDNDEKKVGTIDPATGKITGMTISKDTKISVTYDQNYFNFKLGSYNEAGKLEEQSFNIQGSESLNGVINKVNASDVGVSMFYDSFTDKVTLTRTETGDFNTSGDKEEIVVSGGFMNRVLRFQAEEENGDPKFNGTDPIYVAEQGGQNAIFTINGLRTERNSNSFDINGVTFQLKNTFNQTEGANDPPVTITINNDSNAVFENIKGFIDKYNELIGKINSKTQEEKFRDFLPLSDEQREQLSDKQQEKWEEKAKSGLLRRDSTLTSLLTTMRQDFYGAVESDAITSTYNQLSKIGIKTTANYMEGGKLEIDEAALKKAIEEDPESVESLFRAAGPTNGQRGIAQRLYDSVGKTMDILYEKAGKSYSVNNQFTLGRQLDSLNKQIDRFEDRMVDLEDRYYRQFSAMEKAIQQANSQSAQLMQYFQ